MKNIDKELIDWAIRKIENEYKEDVALLIGQVGGCKIPTDEQSMAFDYFIPATDQGWQLAQTFIIEDMGYDLYPITWERLERIANIEEPRMIFAFAKGEVLYAKSEEDKLRFETLKAEMLKRLQDPRVHFPKAVEFVETAQEIFQTMLFEESLCSVRKAAGGVCNFLMNAIAMLNGTYLERGYMNLTDDLHRMKEYPQRFEEIFREILAAQDVACICEKVYNLILITRNFIKEKRIASGKSNFGKPDYEELAMWYREMRYTFRRVDYYAKINSAEDCYMLGCYLQIEFDAVKDEFNLDKMELMSYYNGRDLSGFAKQAERIEAYLVKILEENKAAQKRYSSIEEFIREN